MQAVARIYIHRVGNGFDVICRIPNVQSASNYLTQVTFRRNGELQAEALLGRHVATDPVVGTHFEQLEANDEISVGWQDLAGASGGVSRIFSGDTD